MVKCSEIRNSSLRREEYGSSTYSTEAIQPTFEKLIEKDKTNYYKDKKINLTESDPQFILEVLEDDYAKLHIHESSSSFRVCDSTEPSYYDLLFKAESGLLRIFHSDDLAEVKKIHDLVKEKVPEVVKSEPMISTSMSRQMNVVRVIQKHPTWSSAHILAHLGYSEGFKSEEIKRHIGESCGEKGVTPLHVAIESRHKTSIEALLEQGASLESKDSVGRTPLHYAALIPDEEILETLLKSKQEYKSLINMKDSYGDTGLHLSIGKDCIKTAIIFLTHKADANILNKDGDRPLHLAIKRQQLSLVRALLLFGADVNLQNVKGESPRHCAATSTCFVGGLLYILDLMRALRCKNPGKNCNEGCSPNGDFNGTPPKNRNNSTLHKTKVNEVPQDEVVPPNVPTPSKDKGIRLLCLDGGGIRGLVIIQTLIDLEKELGEPIFEKFDMVAGTSTGGIIALALSIGKTLEDIRDLYINNSKEIFKGWRTYRSEPLENFLHEIFGPENLFLDIKKPKLLITATRADRKPAELIFFRNLPDAETILGIPRCDQLYGGVMSDTEGMQIWEVARATGAAPSYFPPYGPYVDGGIIANNPTLDALTDIYKRNEAFKKIGLESEVKQCTMVLSLGTGISPLCKAEPAQITFPRGNLIIGLFKYFVWELKDLAELLAEQACQTDNHVTERCKAFCHYANTAFLRLNPQLHEDVPLDASDPEVLMEMIGETSQYLRENREMLDAVKRMLITNDEDDEDQRQ